MDRQTVLPFYNVDVIGECPPVDGCVVGIGEEAHSTETMKG
jgi:hypothetical protein